MLEKGKTFRGQFLLISIQRSSRSFGNFLLFINDLLPRNSAKDLKFIQLSRSSSFGTHRAFPKYE
jgi:hypothetical protein